MERGGRHSKRGQIAVEHLFILMLSLGILIPGTVLFYSFSKNSNHQMISNQVVRIGDEIMHNAETAYYLGPGTRLKISVSIPHAVSSMRLINNELIINFTSYAGRNEAVFFPDVFLENGLVAPPQPGSFLANFHTGTNQIILENDHDIVYIRSPEGDEV